MHIDRARVAEVVKAPDIVQELCAGKDPVRALGQEIQQLDLLGRRIDMLARDDEFVSLLIDDQVVKGQLAAVIGGQAAQHSAHARDHLAHFKRLYNVVVGAKFQAGYLIHGLALGRNHDDRHVGARLADLADDLPAVHDRHHYIKQHHVRIFCLPLGQADRAVLGLGNFIALALKVQAQQFADIFIVLDDQDLFGIAHIGVPTFFVCVLSKKRSCAANAV